MPGKQQTLRGALGWVVCTEWSAVRGALGRVACTEWSAVLAKWGMSPLSCHSPPCFELVWGPLYRWPWSLLVPSLDSAGLSPFPGSLSQLPEPSDPVTSTGEGRACTPGAVAADLQACTTLPHGWNVQLASSAVSSEAEMAGPVFTPVPGAPST